MNILISGASGFVGSALYVTLKAEGHVVKVLTRKGWDETGNSIQWRPDQSEINSESLEGLDAVIHLAGEGIADGRWNEQKKKRILDSRVKGTTFLSETLASLKNPPRVFICASAIGYYGNRGAELLKEESAPTQEFLSQVCQAWEKATAPATAKGIRVVNLRIGIVLGAHGGALKQMLLPFKMGVGGILGDGNQYMSWVALEDVIGIIQHAIMKADLQGPVNTVAPHPVTNKEFTQTLGQVLCRPTIFPMPAFAARLAFGEMADALLLASTRVDASKIVKSGYQFRYPQLQGALQAQLS